jgi:hypothetical protein
MMYDRPDDIEDQAARAAWRRRAQMQGLFCMSCREVPALEHRGDFYDTGLCEACSEPPAADARFA